LGDKTAMETLRQRFGTITVRNRKAYGGEPTYIYVKGFEPRRRKDDHSDR